MPANSSDKGSSSSIPSAEPSVPVPQSFTPVVKWGFWYCCQPKCQQSMDSWHRQCTRTPCTHRVCDACIKRVDFEPDAEKAARQGAQGVEDARGIE